MLDHQGSDLSVNDVLRMTSEIVSAYVGKNSLPMQQIPDIINAVYGTLSGLQGPVVDVPAEPARPAVPIKKSVTPEYIVCLEDGKKLKMLKRHLRSTYDMTPDEYRVKWGLPPDYPMVAPNYAQARSNLAKAIGLGQPRDSFGQAA